MAIATTDTTNAYDSTAASGEIFENITQAAQFTFAENGLLRNLVTTYNMQGTPGLTASVPVYPAATAVSAITAGHDITQGDDVAASAVDITAAEYATMAKIQDIVLESSPLSVAQDTGRVLGDQIAKSMDTVITGLFTSATTEVGPGAAAEMTIEHLLKAAATLRNNSVPMTGLVAVLHPFQAFNMKKALLNAGGSIRQDSNDDSAAVFQMRADELANQAARDYFIGTVSGIRIYESAAITPDGSDDAIGAVFHPAAIGMAMKRDLRIAQERDESFRGFEVVCSSVFGAGILDQKKIVKITSDAAL
jgi:hypothetical protein